MEMWCMRAGVSCNIQAGSNEPFVVSLHEKFQSTNHAADGNFRPYILTTGTVGESLGPPPGRNWAHWSPRLLLHHTHGMLLA